MKSQHFKLQSEGKESVGHAGKHKKEGGKYVRGKEVL